MITNRTRLVAGLLTAIALSVPLSAAVFPSIIFTNLRGTLHVLQNVPCGAVVDVTTPVADGRMEVTPSTAPRNDAIGGGVTFDLTRLEMFFTPFTVQHECAGLTATADFREIGVRLASAVRFIGQPVSEGQYRFTIPKSQVLIFESVMDSLPVPQPETSYHRPSEDVTGLIDMRTHRATLHIALTSRLWFRAGCVGDHCVIDQMLGGRQTADVTGIAVDPATDTDHDRVTDLVDNCPLVPNRRQQKVATPVLRVPQDAWLTSCQAPNIGRAKAADVCHARPVLVTSDAPASFPLGRTMVTWKATDGIDPMVSGQQAVNVVPDRAPVVSCTPMAPERFRVTASDDCSRPTLKLGSFALVNGDVIQIEQTGKPGVRLINTVSRDRVKHFQVGKGEAVIVATDGAGNSSRAACGVAPEVTTDTSKKK